jgi:hypothetical protein
MPRLQNLFKPHGRVMQILSITTVEDVIMSHTQEIHIVCPQCNYSNAASIPSAKYREAVYQPCNQDEDQYDHNRKDHIRCENCHNSFDFYWCAGQSKVENDTDLRNFKST